MIYRQLLDEYSQLKKVQNAIESLHPNSGLTQLDRIRSYKSSTPVKKKVIIGGAGLAGLSCAYELSKLGIDVIILEAQKNHIGGRARTLRLSENVYGEFGAMRIPKKHLLTRHYISEFNLNIRKFIQSNSSAFAFIRGKRFLLSQDDQMKSIFNLKDDEASKSTLDFWLSTIGNLLDSLDSNQRKQLFDPTITDPYLKSLDNKSLYEVLCSSDLSSEAIELLVSTWTMETSLQMSILHFIREELLQIWVDDFDEIVGGTDLLAKEFYKRLTPNILKNSKVVKVVQDNDEIRVSYQLDNGQLQTVSGDWFVCTFPLGIVNKIEFSPKLSASKERAIRRVHYDSATKVLAKASNRFWEVKDKIYGGGSITDGLITSTWYPSDNPYKDNKISCQQSMFLASYSWGQNSRRIDSLQSENVKDFIVANLSNIHPSLKIEQNIMDVYRWNWTNFEWSNGAYAAFLPNEHSDLYNEFVIPEGKILLAGEHTSLTYGWMQGAFESSLRVCEHIMSLS